jgi:hypothetical protein
MLKFKIEFELDEEQLRDIFDSYDIKFSKAKMKQLKKEMNQGFEYVQTDMEERFQEVVEEWIQNLFE